MGRSRGLSPHGMDAAAVPRTRTGHALRKPTLKPVQRTHRRKYTPHHNQGNTTPIDNAIHRKSPKTPGTGNRWSLVIDRPTDSVIGVRCEFLPTPSPSLHWMMAAD